MILRRILMTLIIVCSSSAIAGCQATARPVSVELHPLEKDVLLCRVELPRAWKPVQYLEWAEHNLAEMDHNPENPFYPGTPVYKLHYTFYQGSRHLASVHFQCEEEALAAPGNLTYKRSLVHNHSRSSYRQRSRP